MLKRIHIDIDVFEDRRQLVPGYLVEDRHAMYIDDSGVLWLIRVSPTEKERVYSEDPVNSLILATNVRADDVIERIYARLAAMTGFDFLMTILIPMGADIDFEFVDTFSA
ncbi:hypothetical protein [Paenibacillus contaminans]|uniref:Uncharacterized protein n=1 Tax=Paenibacillus contaminans TaxID=450362 RepID=A0A329MIW8_9BACL|nr:hypothetical protein [Paenibacillus contaminans]RAV19508.1 hypothetical protein DQG23_21210 [Paenibacillus contaminans]